MDIYTYIDIDVDEDEYIDKGMDVDVNTCSFQMSNWNHDCIWLVMA